MVTDRAIRIVRKTFFPAIPLRDLQTNDRKTPFFSYHIISLFILWHLVILISTVSIYKISNSHVTIGLRQQLNDSLYDI